MTRVLPIAIKFADGGTMVVSSISDAKKALVGRWKNKEAAAYRDAVRLVDDAMNGICRPAVAFAAFKKAATEQGLIRPAKPSAALEMLDELWSHNEA